MSWLFVHVVVFSLLCKNFLILAQESATTKQEKELYDLPITFKNTLFTKIP
jgi:hypothetical protein